MLLLGGTSLAQLIKRQDEGGDNQSLLVENLPLPPPGVNCTVEMHVKGIVSRDFDPFWVIYTLPGPHKNRLIRFCEIFSFCEIGTVFARKP